MTGGAVRFWRVLDSFIIPGLVALTYVVLFATSQVRGVAAVVTLFVFGLVMILWSTYRELRTHAAASRAASQGEPRELLALAERELDRRWLARSRLPFHIYRAIGHQLLGDWGAARRALADGELARASGRSRRTWGILHTAQRINLAVHDGDAAAARRLLADELRPALRYVPGAGAEIVGAEAEARVLYAEGKLDDARATFEKLARDVRLGPATRAGCHWFIGRCLADRDPEAARAAFAEAARLAPDTAYAQNSPTSATPAASADTAGTS